MFPFLVCPSANVDILKDIAIKNLCVFTPHGILAVHVFYQHSLLAHSTHTHTHTHPQFHLMLRLLVRVISILNLVPRLSPSTIVNLMTNMQKGRRLPTFCGFSSCKCLEYCLKEPTTNYEGLNIGYWQFMSINILYCTYGTFGPFLLYVLPYV